MTSPTTSADAAAKIAAEMREWATGEGCFDDGIGEGKPLLMVWQTQESYLALADRIATLTQHAEAGAVAWIYKERYGHRDECWIERINRTLPVWEHKDAIPLFLQPAQPASQQGEVHVFQCRRCPVSVESRWLEPECPECGDPCEFDPSGKPAQIPRPTGDKVRGLVEKWRANESTCVMYAKTVRHECADELAAALDQEKNDGR